MKRYRFNLEPVRQQRKVVYEQKAGEFALAMAQLKVEQQQLAEIHHRQAETISAFNEKRRQEGFTARDSVLYLAYLDRLADDEKIQIVAVEKADERVKTAREALDQARIQYEIMEKMKEKSREQYDYGLNREEQNFLDELGGMTSARSKLS